MVQASGVNRLGTERVSKLLLEISAQTTFSRLVYAAYTLTDTYFLSVGVEPLAAAGARHLKVAFGQSHALDRVPAVARDTQHMLQEVQLAFPDWRVEKKHQGLKALHDHLSIIQRQCRTVNLPIPSATDQKLAHLDITLKYAVVGALTFERAACTHDLIQSGQQFNNCVGSYGRQAVRGDVVIVVAKTQQGTPYCCLELRGWVVHQYKLNFNARPREEADLDVAATYLKAARLKMQSNDLNGLSEPLPRGHQQRPFPPENDLPF